jgi:hypothetical protein
MLAGLASAARLSPPDGLVALLTERGRALGVGSMTIYLVDQE